MFLLAIVAEVNSVIPSVGIVVDPEKPEPM